MQYAIIENGKVVNIAEAAFPIAGNWVQSDAAAIGDDYDEQTGEFSRPEAQVVAEPRILTRLQFRNRFTSGEKVAIYMKAETSVQIRIFLDDVNAAEEIDLDDTATIAGVQALEAAMLIGAGRAAEILGGAELKEQS